MIILILIQLFLLPIIQEDTWISFTSLEKGLGTLSTIHDKYGPSAEYDDAIDEFISYHSDLGAYPLLSLEIPDHADYYLDDDPDVVSSFRIEEYDEFENGNFKAVYKNRSEAIANAYINIGRTIFICILLTIGALFFSRDAEILVLNPIERMIEKVKAIAKNPLAAASGEIETAGFLSMTESQKKKKTKKKNTK